MRSGCQWFLSALALWMFTTVACGAQAQGHGLVIITVKAGSAAEKAGIRVGDRLLRYDVRSLSSPFALKAWIENLFDKKEVSLQLQDGTEIVTRTVPVGALGVTVRPDFDGAVLKAYQEGSAPGISPEQSIANWKEAAQASRDAVSIAWLWWSVGQVQEANQNWKEARASYERAWDIVKRENDVASWYVILSALGSCYYRLGEMENSERYYVQGERVAATAQLLGWQGNALMNLGKLARIRGYLPSAKDYFERAHSLREKLAPNSLAVANSLNDLGVVEYDRGDLLAAQNFYARALALREKQDPTSLAVADSLNDLGVVALAHGNLQVAQDYFQRTLSIREKLAPNSLEVAMSLSNLGVVAHRYYDLPAAQDYFQRSLSIREKQDPISLEIATSLNNLGAVARDGGNLSSAEDYFRRALFIREKLPLNSIVARILDNLGDVKYARGDFQAARNYYQSALPIWKKLAPISLDVAETLNGLGDVERAYGNFQAAQDYYQNALAIQENLAPDSLEVASSLYKIAILLRKQHQPKEALPRLERACTLIEQQRGQIPNPDARALLTEQYSDTFQELLLTYLALHDTKNAFATLERARARSLTDQIAERGTDFAVDASKELLDQQRDLNNKRNIATQERSRLDPDKDKGKYAASDERLHSLDAQQRELTARIRRQSPRYASLVYPLPLDLPAVQKTLDPGTLLLEYSVQKDQTLLFAVTKSSLDLFRLPLKQEELTDKVKRLKGTLSDSSSLDDYRPLARQIYDSLLRPVAKQVAAAQRLLLCPDACLHTLPFCALIEKLPQKERFLIEAKPLHSVVSMNVYQQLKQQRSAPSATTLLAYGDPLYPPQDETTPARAAFVKMGRHLAPLPRTADQVNAIAALFAPGARIRLQKAATRTSVLSEAGNVRILHFACHGLLDDREPLASALALTPDGKGDDGLLRAYDIFDKLHLHADLVVLSGCETGLGAEALGKSEGIVGLTRAFEYAGAKSVAVSLWQIADTSSTGLMEAFYRHLKAGKSKDEALRLAQLSLLHGKTSDWRVPFHWAAFQLVGDWR